MSEQQSGKRSRRATYQQIGGKKKPNVEKPPTPAQLLKASEFAYLSEMYPDRAQKEIGAMMDLGASTANEVSQWAISERLLLTNANIDPDHRREYDNKYGFHSEHRQAVKKHLDTLAVKFGGKPLQSLAVIYCDAGSQHRRRDDSPEKLAHLKFGNAVAREVVKLLGSATICGLGWGKAVESVIVGIESMKGPHKTPTELFVPICGHPFVDRPVGISSTSAAERLAAHFQCKTKFGLRGVGVRIKSDLVRDNGKNIDKNIKLIRDFCLSNTHYREIFDEKEGHIKSIDAIVTGLGDVSAAASDPYYKETSELDEKVPSWLTDSAAGNIGGLWLPKDGVDETVAGKVAEMNERWLGINMTDLKACVERGHTKLPDGRFPPGVIACALGKQKLGIVQRAMGLVNHLFIDRELADALYAVVAPNNAITHGSAPT